MTDVHEATIKNLTIEVKVMKIGNRQVTQSVFRQLPDKLIIHPDTGELRGIPWGRVNYHVGCEHVPQNHIHIVWQEESTLYRSTAGCPWSHNGHYFSGAWDKLDQTIGRHESAWLCARVLDGWVPTTQSEGKPYIPARMTIDFDGYKDTFYPCDTVRGAWEYNEWSFAQRKLCEEIQKRDLPVDSEKIKSLLMPFLKKKRALQEAWLLSYAELESLDQLFIAV